MGGIAVADGGPGGLGLYQLVNNIRVEVYQRNQLPPPFRPRAASLNVL